MSAGLQNAVVHYKQKRFGVPTGFGGPDRIPTNASTRVLLRKSYLGVYGLGVQVLALLQYAIKGLFSISETKMSRTIR